MDNTNKPCRAELIASGAVAIPKSCPRHGLAKCPPAAPAPAAGAGVPTLTRNIKRYGFLGADEAGAYVRYDDHLQHVAAAVEEATRHMVPLSADGKSVFIDGAGDVLLAHAAAAPVSAAEQADEMPGMWEPADVSGGETDCQPARQQEAEPAGTTAMCERKTNDIMQREGYQKTGYVLMKDDPAARICVSDQGAVSWFTRDQWNWLMHNRDHVEFQWPKPITAARAAAPADGLELPELPHTTYNGYSDGSEPLWTADQMHAYARAALAMRQPQGSFERGYFCAVAALIHETGCVSAQARSLFTQGGDPTKADPFDIETFQEYGLIPVIAAKQAGKEGA